MENLSFDILATTKTERNFSYDQNKVKLRGTSHLFYKLFVTTVKFVYTKQELPIQIAFVDQDGRQLQGETTVNAKYGEKLSLEPTVIEGYTVPDKQEITVEKVQKVTFVYQKIIRPERPTNNP